MNLSKLDEMLDSKLGPDWHDWELENITFELGAELDMAALVKIAALKALQENTDTVLNDVEYFLRFVEIANGNVPDIHHTDIPTSLELDFALREAERILGEDLIRTNMLDNLIRYVVNNEGHGRVSPFMYRFTSLNDTVPEENAVAYEVYANELLKGNR